MDNKSLLTELIKLARIDKNEHDLEYSLMLDLAKKLSIEKDTFDSLFTEYADFEAPNNELNRIIQLYRLVLVMNIDGNAFQEEMDFIRNMAVKLGINLLAIEEIFEEMEKHTNNAIPGDVLANIFRKHHN
jgi:hypothetical protein